MTQKCGEDKKLKIIIIANKIIVIRKDVQSWLEKENKNTFPVIVGDRSDADLGPPTRTISPCYIHRVLYSRNKMRSVASLFLAGIKCFREVISLSLAKLVFNFRNIGSPDARFQFGRHRRAAFDPCVSRPFGDLIHTIMRMS